MLESSLSHHWDGAEIQCGTVGVWAEDLSLLACLPSNFSTSSCGIPFWEALVKGAQHGHAGFSPLTTIITCIWNHLHSTKAYVKAFWECVCGKRENKEVGCNKHAGEGRSKREGSSLICCLLKVPWPWACPSGDAREVRLNAQLVCQEDMSERSVYLRQSWSNIHHLSLPPSHYGFFLASLSWKRLQSKRGSST